MARSTVKRKVLVATTNENKVWLAIHNTVDYLFGNNRMEEELERHIDHQGGVL